MADTMCACGAAAAGWCQFCHGVLCEPCYQSHCCETASNAQCGVCFNAPGTFMCLCEFPCPVSCQDCAGKHSANNPMHMLVPAQYRQVITSREAFVRMKARQLSMHQLEADLGDALYRIGEAKRIIEEQTSLLIERITECRNSQMEKLDVLQRQLEGFSEAMQASYFSLLLEAEDHRVGQELVAPLRRFLEKQYSKASETLKFSSDFSTVNVEPQISIECPLLNLLSGETLPGSKVCSNCQILFQSVPNKSSLEEDFCSAECFERFKALITTDGGLTECRYCGLDFVEETGVSVRLPCKKHSYHSKDCFIRYLLKRSRFFKNGALFSCEVCRTAVRDKFVSGQFSSEKEYAAFQNGYRDQRCMQCRASAEILTDCNHILCETCGQSTNAKNHTLCPICQKESFPDCQMCELNGTLQLSCRHFLCSLCFSEETRVCPVCRTSATVTQRAPKRAVY